MLKTVLTASILLTATLSLSPLASELEFDPALVRVDPQQHLVAYSGADTIAAGAVWRLPVITCHILVDAQTTPDQISWRSPDPILLGRADAGFSLSDIPTVSESAHAAGLVELASRSSFGDDPVTVTGIVQGSASRVAELLVLPVTISDQGNLVLHRRLEVTVDGQIINAVPGRPASASIPRPAAGGSAESDVLRYVVITGADMAEPMQRLARYRTGTGITAAVVLIDSILSAYDGCDDAERLREYLKDFHAEGGQYVLLAGDETVLPIRYTYHFNTSRQPETAHRQICDLYFADLTGDWEVDGDGVWGEPTADSPDYTPELRVGRLPFNTIAAAENWIEKLITYETNPGNGRYDYLSRSYFFTSDQMRDYAGVGQHTRIAASFPSHFDNDTLSGIEQASGDDPSPINSAAADLLDNLATGYGILNVMGHGCNGKFEVRTSGYNTFPKSSFITRAPSPVDADFGDLIADSQVGFWYSIACDNAAFDMDQPPYNDPYPNVVQTLLELRNAGAVACIANTRWGWVGASHLMQKAFFDSLFAHPERPVIDAMYASKERYYYYRDIVCGQGFFGDPAMKLWLDTPDSMQVITRSLASSTVVTVYDNDLPLGGINIIVSDSSGVLARGVSDSEGQAVFDLVFEPEVEYAVAAVGEGYTTSWSVYNEQIVSDVDDDRGRTLPTDFALSQNYPNPFNPKTTIEFELPTRQMVSLAVYNVMGQRVQQLVRHTLSAGRHRVMWNGRDASGDEAASGVYFYRLSTETGDQMRKMVLLR